MNTKPLKDLLKQTGPQPVKLPGPPYPQPTYPKPWVGAFSNGDYWWDAWRGRWVWHYYRYAPPHYPWYNSGSRW